MPHIFVKSSSPLDMTDSISGPRLSPFRIKETLIGEPVLHTNQIQKVLCAIVTISLATRGIITPIQIWPKSQIADNPWIIFQICLSLIMPANVPVLANTFWRKQKSWISLFELSNSKLNKEGRSDNSSAEFKSSFRTNWTRKVSQKSVLTHFCFGAPWILAATALVFSFTLHISLEPVDSMDPLNDTDTDPPGAGVPSEANNYSGGSFFKFPDENNDVGLITLIWTLVAMIGESLVSNLFIIFELYFEMLPTIAALTLHNLSLEFEAFLSVETSETAVIKHYFKLKEIIDNLNSVLSSVALLNFLMGIAFYPWSIVMLFDSDDVSTKVACIPALTIQSGAIIIAAKANERFKKLRTWWVSHGLLVESTEQQAFRRRRQISLLDLDTTDSNDELNQQATLFKHVNDRLSLFYLHICEEPIGLNCGSLFTVTSSSVAAGLGLLATYSVIALQLYAAPSKIPPDPNFVMGSGFKHHTITYDGTSLTIYTKRE